MPHVTKNILPLLLLLLSVHLHFTSAARNQFEKWYPEFGFIFNNILHSNCTTEYETYLFAQKNISHVDEYTGGDKTNQLAQPVVNCILENASEFIKSNIGSAQVLLGLTPSMLAAIGPSTEETSLLFVIGRRPLLALCIAAGSPAVFPMRSFEYKNPLELLKDREGRVHPPKLGKTQAPLIMALEYLMVLIAIFNIAFLSKELGVQVVCNFAPQLTYLVLLWAFLIVIIHFTGSISMLFRVCVSYERSSNPIIHWIKTEFTPFKTQRTIKVLVMQETYWFTITSWFTAILTVCHTIWGTLVFSSMLFISVRDAVSVIGRYMISVMCCRIILMYELAKLRDCDLCDIHFDRSESEQARLRDSFPTMNVDGSEVEMQPGGISSKSTGYVQTWSR